MLEEPQAANAALGQFKQFILDNKLEDTQTLRLLNSYSKGNREDIVRGFVEISSSVASLQIEGHGEPTGLLEAGLGKTEAPDLEEQDEESQE